MLRNIAQHVLRNISCATLAETHAGACVAQVAQHMLRHLAQHF
jgi:hypothetical protein